jgi:signal transduction histidine kinase
MALAARTRVFVSRPVSEVAQPRRAFLEANGLRHLLVMPLLFHDAVFGTITVAHARDMSWDEDSLRLLGGAASHLAMEFAHVRLLEAERRRAEDLDLVNQLGRLVAQQTDLASVLSTAVTELSRIMHVPRVHMFLVDSERTTLRGVACTDPSVDMLAFPLTSSAAVVHAFHNREVVIVDDASTDPRAHRPTVERTRSILAVPLVSAGESIGAIAIVAVDSPRSFSPTEVARAVAVANLVSPAITNANMIGDLRKSYDELARTQAELVTHERLAALGELSAVIAHEVRNPLAIIFNSLGALRRVDRSHADASMLLDIVGEEATRLNRIVGELLDFVRPYTSHPSLVHLDFVVSGAVEAALRAEPEAKVRVRTDISVKHNEVYLDGTMLQQALINLIVNAMQATPDGRWVVVRATDEVLGDSVRLLCEVVDEGPGISGADLARVFQPFFTTKATGTGLGLALVRRMMAALGGTVDVASSPSGGAVFSLSLPLARTQPGKLLPT